MSAPPNPKAPREGDEMTANDRFKERFTARLWGGVVLATLVHFSVLAFWPELTAQDISVDGESIELFDLIPEVKVPPPPEKIARPATPVITVSDVPPDATIVPNTWENFTPEVLPPPPAVTGRSVSSDKPGFTPHTVKPQVKNRAEVTRALEREYPPMLRDAGIGGVVLVWIYVDETGKVQNTRVNTTSGHVALDDAALKVADVIQFTPALNLDKHVAVWISIPIAFQIR
jgi:protein TonB